MRKPNARINLLMTELAKPFIWLVLNAYLWSISAIAQSNEAVSSPININITKEIKPPILTVNESTIIFKDKNNNGSIDANETAEIRFKVRNSGRGEGAGLKLEATVTGSNVGLIFKLSEAIQDVIAVGQEKEIVFPFQSNLQTIDGEAIFTLKLNEPQGFGTDPIVVKVNTKKFLPPKLELVDYTITGTTGEVLKKKIPFTVQFLFQNTGYGIAERVNYTINYDSKVVLLSGASSGYLGTLASGQQKDIKLEFIIPDSYNANDVQLSTNITNSEGKYGESKQLTLKLNTAFSPAQFVVSSEPESKFQEIIKGSLKSDVDRDIPEVGVAHPERFALIIGNEDYASKQPGMSVESNVSFANNDAVIFAEYATKTLGVPSNQLKLLTDATSGQMRQGISWLVNNIKAQKGKAEIFFYYSGHGLPDEDKQPYLVPVDASGLSLEDAGVSLQSLYDSLGKYETQKTIVFLDACFSGGARNKPLIAMKAVKVTPKNQQLTGQVVVLSSSSGNETSGVYDLKMHGYFTYYLLKNLQQSKGKINLKLLSEQISDQVLKVTSNESRPQHPQTLSSPILLSIWHSWMLIPNK